jgi:hypothetical protein
VCPDPIDASFDHSQAPRMSETYLALEPTYFSGPDPRATPHGRVAVRLELGEESISNAARLARWLELTAHLERTGDWTAGEDRRAIAAWLDKVASRNYQPVIISSIVAQRSIDFSRLSLPERLAVAGELLTLGSGLGVRFRALILLDFVAGGVATPSDPPSIVANRAANPASWATDPALAAGIAMLAQAALAQESWPGNRAKRYLAERPGLAALL